MSSIWSKLTNLGGLITGTLSVPHGGSGATTLTSNGVLLGNSTSAISATTAGTAGQLLVGTAGAPAFGNTVSVNTNFSGGLYGNIPFIYNFTDWTDTSSTTISNNQTNPTAGSVSQQNNNNDITASAVSSNTTTFTFSRSGQYLVLFNVRHTHTNNYAQCSLSVGLGGTSTMLAELNSPTASIATCGIAANTAATVGNPDCVAMSSVIISASSTQTMTVKPTGFLSQLGPNTQTTTFSCRLVIISL